MEYVAIIELVQVIWVGPNSMATDFNPNLLCEGLAAYLTAASFAWGLPWAEWVLNEWVSPVIHNSLLSEESQRLITDWSKRTKANSFVLRLNQLRHHFCFKAIPSFYWSFF